MRSKPGKKNAEKCGKNAEKNAENAKKMRKNAEKCRKKVRSKIWDLEKSPDCPDSGQGMGKKITSPKPRQNTAKNLVTNYGPYQ
jgi:hypothetical protein